MACTQKCQLVRFPKSRVQKQWFRHFNDHKDFQNEGTLASIWPVNFPGQKMGLRHLYWSLKVSMSILEPPRSTS